MDNFDSARQYYHLPQESGMRPRRSKKPELADEKPAGVEVDDAEPGGSSRKPSQAVVIVHGMGEQRPMETIRSFVRTVWSTDPRLTEGKYGSRKPDPEDPDGQAAINKSWVHPDNRAKSHELRRITTPYDVHERRTDFFELYWSDITQGTTVERLKAWVKGLLFRKWSDVPRDARKLYVVVWVMVLVMLAPPAALAVMKWFDLPGLVLPAWFWTAGAAVIATFVGSFLVPYFGDVAIYVRADPGTIGKRREARERGLALLGELMEDPRYDRIVLVAHSLGTILAYDLLQILWTDYGPGPGNSRQEPEVLAAFQAVGTKALPIDSAARAKSTLDTDELAAFRALQWQTYMALRHNPAKPKRAWKISDFVTFGSPLTHAEFLVTRNAADFNKAVDERLLATCPPVSEWKEPGVLYPQSGKPRHPHHGSVFAATRWTNVFDKGNGWLTGDPISGPLRENFGPGVGSIQVRLRWKLGRIFTHTQYWSLKATGQEILPSGKPGSRSHLDVLRDAVDLGRKLEP